MYNGIGLQTPRGSGTNGYVQRNLAFVKSKKDKIDYKTEEELNKLDQGLNKQPNREILDHERKRKVELKCMEMQELMEEQGYSEKEVNNKVNMFRKMLMAKEGVSESSAVDKDEHGRPIARATHQLAEANQEKNERLKEAFGLTDYVEGSAFDPDRKAKEEAAKAAALAQKKYSVVNSSDEGEANNESSSASHKKKKKRRHESGSPERGKERRKKSRKHKKDRSHSKRHRKSKGHSKKRSVEKRRKRHQSSSESETEIESESDNMTVPSKAVTTQSEKLQEIPGPDKNINSESQTIAPLPQIPVPEIKSASPALEEKNLTTKQQDTLEGSREITNLVTNSLSKNEGTKVSVSREVNQPSEGRYSNPKGHTGSGRRSRSESSTSSSSRSRSRNRSRVKSHSPSWSPSPTRSSHRRSRSRSRSRHYSSGSDRSSGKDEKQRHHRRQSRSDRYSRSPSIRRRRGSPSHLDKRRITSARKRPVPYYRPSPSPSGSDSDGRGGRGRGPSSCSSYSSRHRSRSRSSFASRSRFRSLSRSPSLDNIQIRRRKGGHPQHNQAQPQPQHYQKAQPKIMPLMQVQTQPQSQHHLSIHNPPLHHHNHHHVDVSTVRAPLSTTNTTNSARSHRGQALTTTNTTNGNRPHRNQPQGPPQPLMMLQPQPQLQALAQPLLHQQPHHQQKLQQKPNQAHQHITATTSLNHTLSRFHMQQPVGNLIS